MFDTKDLKYKDVYDMVTWHSHLIPAKDIGTLIVYAHSSASYSEGYYALTDPTCTHHEFDISRRRGVRFFFFWFLFLFLSFLFVCVHACVTMRVCVFF